MTFAFAEAERGEQNLCLNKTKIDVIYVSQCKLNFFHIL